MKVTIADASKKPTGNSTGSSQKPDVWRVLYVISLGLNHHLGSRGSD